MTVRDRDLGRGETSQIRARAIVYVMIGILAALVSVAVGLGFFFSDRVGMTFVDSHAFPAPGVVPHEDRERLRLEAQQKAALSGAGGRQPIDAAMAAIVARGSHAFDPLGAPP